MTPHKKSYNKSSAFWQSDSVADSTQTELKVSDTAISVTNMNLLIPFRTTFDTNSISVMFLFLKLALHK